MIAQALREFQRDLETLPPEVTLERRAGLLEEQRGRLTAWRDKSLAELKAAIEQIELPAARTKLQ